MKLEQAAGPVDVLVLSSIFYTGHQLTDQRVARALAARDLVVSYVDPGLRPFSRARNQAQGRSERLGRTRVDTVEVFTPLALPLGGRPVIGAVNAVLTALQLFIAFRQRLGHDGRILVFSAHPIVLQVMRRWRNVVVVKDDYAAGAELIGGRSRTLVRRRRRTLSAADTITVVSHELESSLLRQGFATQVVGPGVDLPATSTTEDPELRAIPHPRALFVGMISDRIDLDLLRAVVSSGWHLVIAGGYQPTFTRQDQLDDLLATDGVTVLGWQAPEKVQSIAQWCDVGVLPYTRSAFNWASSPLKLLEYLAAGLPVVSTRLPSIVEQDPPDVFFVEQPADVGGALADSLLAATDSRAEARVQFAAANSWAVRADRYAELLGLTASPAP